MLAIHFAFALIFLSLPASDYARDWEDEAAEVKNEK